MVVPCTLRRCHYRHNDAGSSVYHNRAWKNTVQKAQVAWKAGVQISRVDLQFGRIGQCQTNQRKGHIAGYSVQYRRGTPASITNL